MSDTFGVNTPTFSLLPRLLYGVKPVPHVWGKVPLAGAATSIIFVAIKVLFVLFFFSSFSRQNFCLDKNDTCGSSRQ